MRCSRRALVLFLILCGLPATSNGGLVGGAQLQVSPTTIDAESPSVSSDPGGRFVVVWSGNLDVFARRYDADAVPLGASFQVNTYTTARQLVPRVAIDAAGGFLVVWQGDGEDGSGTGVFAQRYDASGTAQGGEFPVNTYTTGDQQVPVVAAGAGGSFVVVWHSAGQDGDGKGVVGRRFDSSGTPLGPEFVVNGYTTGAQQYAAVASDGPGNFVVVWQSLDPGHAGVFGQRFDTAGATVGPEFLVAQVATLTGPRVTADATGSFVVTWHDYDANDLGIFARRFDAAGTPQGAAFQVNTTVFGRQVAPVVAVGPGGGFVVLWESFQILPGAPGNEKVLGQQYDAAGTMLGPEFEVNASAPKEDEGNASPAVASDAAGDFVVAWGFYRRFEGGTILARRYADPARVPLAAKNVSIKDASNPSRRRVTFRSVDPVLSTSPAVGVDPTADGGFLHVYNADGTGDSACFALPAGGWSASGDPAHPLFVYHDPTFANGPCRVAMVRGGKVPLLRAACSAGTQPITYSLDEPQQTSVGVSFTSGSATYCALLGGTIVKDSAAQQRFVAKKASTPVACPVPPASCP
jgi:hypothetical protein